MHPQASDNEAVPFFSVVIPLFNKERYVLRAVTSVLNQSYPDFELIVVDDGSTDGGADAVGRIAAPRVRIVTQPNMGVSAARNTGIACAQGECVAFLDADDEWSPDFLSRVRGVFRQQPAAQVVFTGYRRHPGQSPTWKDSRLVEVTDYFSFARVHQPIHSSSVAVRRDVFDKVDPFPVGVARGEDLDVWFRLAWSLETLYFIPEVLSTFYIEASDSARLSRDSSGQYFDWYFWDNYQVWLREGKVPDHLRKSTAKYINGVVLTAVIGIAYFGDLGTARTALFQRASFQTSPARYCTALAACYFPFLVNTIRKVRRLACSNLARVRRPSDSSRNSPNTPEHRSLNV